jgi:acetylornithine/succinyldiaminopimelate/putrescine aminotransferase
VAEQVLDREADRDRHPAQRGRRELPTGNRLKQRLHSLISEVPQIADIRGPGFMNAVEFTIELSANPVLAVPEEAAAQIQEAVQLFIMREGHPPTSIDALQKSVPRVGRALDAVDEAVRQ